MRETEKLKRRIVETLEYQPETGLFRWKSEGYGRRKGWFNTSSKAKQCLIMLDRKSMTVSRVAWLLQTGDFPKKRVSFVDKNPHNIVFSNLYLEDRTKKEKDCITCEDVRERVEYDPQTGLFRRKILKNYKNRNGWTAGTSHSMGYCSINIYGHQYLAHQIAWLYVNGSWGLPEVDHKDGDRKNNRIENLRVVTHQANTQNQVLSKANKSGCTGVYYRKKNNLWVASITVNATQIHLGCYKTFEEAVLARTSANVEYGFGPSHGKERKQ